MPTQSLEERPTKSVELLIEQSAGGQVDSTTLLSWCISRSMAEELKHREIDDPYLLIVVTNGQFEQERYVVPLSSGARYIRFTKPGTNLVHAVIVQRKGELLKKHKGAYTMPVTSSHNRMVEQLEESLEVAVNAEAEQSVIDGLYAQIRKAEEGEEELRLDPYMATDPIGDPTTVAVSVPEEMFAQSRRLTNYLGRVFWDSEPRDQCQLRRRAMITVAAAPICIPIAILLMVGWYLVNLGTVLGAKLIGKRGSYAMYGLNPFELPTPKEITYRMKDSFWFSKPDEDAYDGYRSRAISEGDYWQLFNPVVLLLTTGLVYAASALLGDGLLVLVAMAGAIIGFIIVAVVMTLVYRLNLNRRWDAAIKKRQEAREAARRDQTLLELDELACGMHAHPVDYSELPKQRKTFRLRYSHLKSKVCKPFAS